MTSIFKKTTYDNYEILIIENNSTELATFEYYERLAATRSDVVRVVRWSGEFNFAKLMNFGRAESHGEELAIAFNDIDYCLKLREKGMLVVYTPEVELYHYESVSRGLENNWSKRIRFHREWAYMNRRWASYYAGKGDPYVNPNFMWEDQLNRYYKLP